MALFPKTVAAVQATANATKKADQAQYEIGKALFEEAGPSGPVGVNNGSGKKLIRVQIELRRLGFPYSLEHLRDLRSVYENFPVADRSPTASWTVHLVAGDPENSQSH